MISTATRIRIKNILNRLETNQLVTLEERIFLNKLSNVSRLVSEWVASALGAEASSIDNEYSLRLLETQFPLRLFKSNQTYHVSKNI